MATYAALLRGINLGSRNRVSMPDLRELFLALGSEDVETYVQSGNVVFKSSARSAKKLTAAIEERIAGDLGLEVTVILRTKAQLAKLLAGNPFAKGEKDPLKLHVTFLAAKPAAPRVRDLDSKYGGRDKFRVVGQDVYLHTPGGYGKSKLSNAYFERGLDVAATTRNWTTVTKLAELAAER